MQAPPRATGSDVSYADSNHAIRDKLAPMTIVKCARAAAIAALIACVAPATPCIAAASYPSKPVRFIVALPPGGHADLVARIIGQKLSETYGRAFVVDNRGGAAGVIAEEIVARSAADGYT